MVSTVFELALKPFAFAVCCGLGHIMKSVSQREDLACLHGGHAQSRLVLLDLAQQVP